MTKQRSGDVFNQKWILECAIEVTARDPITSMPISAVCKFCKTFGKDEPDENEPRKRKRSQNIQLFKKPWRSDKMKDHNKRMHSAQWQLYQKLSEMEKKAFFDGKAPPPANSILRTFQPQVDDNMAVISFTSTCDLYDTFLDDNVRIPILEYGHQWISYGNITKFSGTVVTVKCYEDNSRVKEILEEKGNHHHHHRGKVLVVDGGGSKRCALLGDMIAQAAIQNGDWNGIIIYGCVRDVEILQTLPIGIMAIGCTPRKSTRRQEGQTNIPITIGNITIQPNEDYVFADANGIIFINKDKYHEVHQPQNQQE